VAVLGRKQHKAQEVVTDIIRNGSEAIFVVMLLLTYL
jgi:hypothetical protein